MAASADCRPDGHGEASNGRPPHSDVLPQVLCRLADGTQARIRAIQTTDAEACCAMLRVCSPKSLYSRYERVIDGPLNELADALCSPDRRFELTAVAELTRDGPCSLIGVAQVLADPNRDTAEYAVLVADRWQNLGLGSALTDYCLTHAHDWGLRRMIAEFLPSNMRMIRILEARAFDLQRDLQEHVVSGQKILADPCSVDGGRGTSNAKDEG